MCPASWRHLLEVHLMLLQDEVLAAGVRHWISERLYNAEWALMTQLEQISRQFDEMEDPYLRERKADLEQVADRILRYMRGAPACPVAQPPEPAADAVQPAAGWHGRCPAGAGGARPVAGRYVAVQAQRVRRLCDGGGRQTSHTAIVARSMDIPAVVGARAASQLIRQDDWIIIDGNAGIVLVDPSPIILEEYRFRQRQEVLERERFGALAPHPLGDAGRAESRVAGQY